MMGKIETTRETASGGAARIGSQVGGHSSESGATATANRPGDRRGFLVRLMAVVIGGVVTIFPFAAGLLVFTDPWRQTSGSKRVKVATLDEVPDDGVPRRFSVSENQVDAWNYYPNQPVGAVYLRRTKGSETVEALQATCPHAGCMVDYSNSDHVFKCPCHNSSFQPDGKILQPSPAPRSMDTLECKVVEHAGVKEVWVVFQNFYTGSAEKIAKV